MCHNADRFHKVRIIGQDCRLLKFPLERITNEMYAEIDIRSLFFRFPNMGNIKGDRAWNSEMGTEIWRLCEARPFLGC